MENLYAGSCIRTFTGKYFDVFNPDPKLICIEDIAHALSHVSRFNGHTHKPLTVAQHSVLVCWQCPERLHLAGLLHDASEAYLPDMPGPIKERLPGFKDLENSLMNVIATKFGFEWPDWEVKMADKEILEMEWEACVLNGQRFDFWGPQRAKDYFLEVFEGIMQKAAKV